MDRIQKLLIAVSIASGMGYAATSYGGDAQPTPKPPAQQKAKEKTVAIGPAGAQKDPAPVKKPRRKRVHEGGY